MDCKRCGARVPQGISICPECGARQSRQARYVRCARCGRRTLADLTVCPHCGRTLRPAGPRLGLWLAGAVAVVLAGLIALNRLPVAAAWQQAVRLEERLVGLVQIPELPAASASQAAASSTTSASPTAARPGASQGSGAGVPAALPAAARPSPTATPTSAGAGIPQPSLILSVTLTVIPPTTIVPSTVESTATATSTPPAPTASPTPNPPTDTPAPPSPPPPPPTETPADTTRYYTVRQGDTFIDIGNATGIDWQEIAKYNNMTSRSLLLPGMKLKLPPTPGASEPASPAAAPNPAPNPAPEQAPTQAPQRRTYRVQPGDSLMVIGNKFGVPWQSIAQANGLNASSMLQVGQELTIPAK